MITLSEFMTTLKEELGIEDLPQVISDETLLDRFKRHTLRSFSAISPRVLDIVMDETMLKDRDHVYLEREYAEYAIPRRYYETCEIMGVAKFEPYKPSIYSDVLIPTTELGNPASVLATVSDIRMLGSLGSCVTRTPTARFQKPNIIRVYNGWTTGNFSVELIVTHDYSLSTIDDGLYDSLLELAVLDAKSYLYNKLKRKDGMEVGIGNIKLMIEEWSGAAQERKELLNRWDEEGAALDYEHIRYF